MFKKIMVCLISCFLSGCGFHLQGQMSLAPPLQRIYLQTTDPYGLLARHLRQYLHASHVEVVNSIADADAALVILQNDETDVLLSVNSTQQTRQFNLILNVTFEITDNKGAILVIPQVMSESRTITTQSNLILGSSNEANLFYQQMKRAIAYKIVMRIASKDITEILITALAARVDQPIP